jgi:hypothetical protein
VSLNDFTSIEIYFPIIDATLTELKRQFFYDDIVIMRAVCALLPGTENFLDADGLFATNSSLMK